MGQKRNLVTETGKEQNKNSLPLELFAFVTSGLVCITFCLLVSDGLVLV